MQDDGINGELTLDTILNEIFRRRALDFHGYRRTTVERRAGLRMLAVRAASYQEYLSYLRAHPAEIDRLVDNLTLKVSSFFREPRALELVAGRILDEILRTKDGSPDKQVRIWSAGCARGEEPYSMAISLLERTRRTGQAIDFLVCATDIDRDALRDAELGRYGGESLDKTPPEIVARYFKAEDDEKTRMKWPVKVLGEDVRGRVRFFYHDLVTGDEPPMGRDVKFDLIVCRNVFIYFQQALQNRVLRMIEDSLADGCFLIMGESESILPGMASGLECVDRKASAYRKNSGDRSGAPPHVQPIPP